MPKYYPLNGPHQFAEVYNLHWQSIKDREALDDVVKLYYALGPIGRPYCEIITSLIARIKDWSTKGKWLWNRLGPIDMMFSSLADWCVINGNPPNLWWFGNWKLLEEGILILTASYEAASKQTPVHIDYLGHILTSLKDTRRDHLKMITSLGPKWYEGSVDHTSIIDT